MPPHSLGSGTISFGLVSIPVRLYTAASSGNVAFNQLHATCGSRIKQQIFCPKDNRVVERNELVRGYEFAKDQYVRVSDEELKSMEGEASKIIDIGEFVPLEQVDPIYFEKTYYLGPDKGGEKAYRLLADAMEASGRVALAKFTMRGKENLVLIRAAKRGSENASTWRVSASASHSLSRALRSASATARGSGTSKNTPVSPSTTSRIAPT